MTAAIAHRLLRPVVRSGFKQGRIFHLRSEISCCSTLTLGPSRRARRSFRENHRSCFHSCRFVDRRRILRTQLCVRPERQMRP
jgi:hypothetical protein